MEASAKWGLLVQLGLLLTRLQGKGRPGKGGGVACSLCHKDLSSAPPPLPFCISFCLLHPRDGAEAEPASYLDLLHPPTPKRSTPFQAKRGQAGQG